MPTFDGSDDPVRIGGPAKGYRVLIGFGEEAVDGGLQVDKRMESTALEAPSCELGEEAFDGIEPRARCGREMEGETLVAVEPGPNFRMLVDRVVVENDVHGLVRRDLGVDQVQESDELLMPVALHVLPDDRPVEHIQRSEQRGGSIALVVV